MIRELLDKVRGKVAPSHDDAREETEAEHYAHASVGRDRMAALYAESPEAHALQLAAASVRLYQDLDDPDDYRALAKALAPDAVWCFIGRKSQTLWDESTAQALRYVRCNCDACKPRQRYRQRGVS